MRRISGNGVAWTISSIRIKRAMIFQEKLPTKPRFKKDTSIELSYGYHTPLAMQISQNLIASKHYDLVARIPIHNSYGDGYFWVWSKHAGEARSAENVVCEAMCTWKRNSSQDTKVLFLDTFATYFLLRTSLHY